MTPRNAPSRVTLASALATERPLVTPLAHDALSARMIARAGFRAFTIGGSAMLAAVQATKPYTYSHGARAWQQIAAFAADARRSAARVVIAYPNIYYKAVGRHNGRFLTELERRASELGIPTIGRPHDYEFGYDLAFNTSYHQSQQGQQLSTERLYRDLAAAGFL